VLSGKVFAFPRIVRSLNTGQPVLSDRLGIPHGMPCKSNLEVVMFYDKPLAELLNLMDSNEDVTIPFQVPFGTLMDQNPLPYLREYGGCYNARLCMNKPK
jgi:hypothetical protein